MRRILMPVDGSQASDRAVQYLIRRIAADWPADVHVLHVEPSPAGRGVDPDAVPPAVGALQREEEERATRSAERLLMAAAVPHVCRHERGEAADAIARYARMHACDEIVMGTRGMGALRSLIPGSVATRVVHLVEVPVTLVK